MSRFTHLKLAFFASALGVLALASSAQALTLNNLSAAPANNDAGANSNFSVHIGVGEASDDIKDLTIHLPPGLVGDPTGPPTCTETQLNANNCPADTQVGTSNSTVLLLGLPPEQQVTGKIFNVVPHQGEPARFGIVLMPPIGDPVILQSGAKLRGSDFGLDSELKGLPNTASGLPIDITSLDVVLFGHGGDPAPPDGPSFIRNPTSCGTKTTGFTANSYASPNTNVTGSATYESDQCPALDFSPDLDVTVETPPGGNTNPELVTTITQADTEAGLQRAVVKLPAALTADNDKLADVCSVSDFNAGTCAPEAIIGSAVASSPLLAEPLAGPVAIVQPASPGLPDLGLDLRGPLPLKLRGNLGFDPFDGRPVNVFNNLPDVPISEFTLTFNGGPGGFVEQTADICEADVTFDTLFDGHNGEQTTGPVTPTRIGCVKPTAQATVRKPRSDAPKGTFVVDAGDTPIQSADVKLSKQLRFARGRTFLRGASASDSSGPLPDSAIQRKRRSALVTSDDSGGTDTIELRVRKGALLPSRRGKPSYEIAVTDAEGRLTILTLP
jgi:hypothetical protein